MKPRVLPYTRATTAKKGWDGSCFLLQIFLLKKICRVGSWEGGKGGGSGGGGDGGMGGGMGCGASKTVQPKATTSWFKSAKKHCNQCGKASTKAERPVCKSCGSMV